MSPKIISCLWRKKFHLSFFEVCPGLIFQYDVDFFRSVAFKSEVIEFVAILGDKSTRPKHGYMYQLYPLSEKISLFGYIHYYSKYIQEFGLCYVALCFALQTYLSKTFFLDIFSVGLISETKCLVYLE